MRVNPELNKMFRHSYTRAPIREENEAGLILGICIFLAMTLFTAAVLSC